MKNLTESIKAKLKNVSREWNKNHQLTLIRYFQERFLYRLSISEYRNNFFLKGGVLIYAIERRASRPTLDLDLLARKIEADQDKIKTIFREICSMPCEEDGVIFDQDSIETSEIVKEGNYSGVRVKVLSTLGNIKQRIQIDTGFGDIVVPGPVEMIFPTLIELPNPELLAYSVESLIAEKFEAMINLAELNSRMKDFYDIYRILQSGNYDEKILHEAIANTINRRGTKLTQQHVIFSENFGADENRASQWKAFLKRAGLNEDIGLFDIMQVIKEKLKPVYDELAKSRSD